MAQIIKKGKGYMVRVTYRDAQGKQHKKSKAGFKTKAQARAYGAKLEEMKYAGLISTNNPYFGDYFKEWYESYKKNKVSLATQKAYEWVMNTIYENFPNKRIGDITRRQYQLFINEYGKNHSKTSVSKLNSTIKTCLKNAVLDSVITRSFADGVELVYDKEKTRDVEYLSIAELQQLTAELKKKLRPKFPIRYMILTIIYTGMRLSEIAALTWDDINFNFQTISINKAWQYKKTKQAKSLDDMFGPTKNPNSVRTIHVSEELLDILVQLKANNNKMVFLNSTYQTMPGSSSINRTLRETLAKCGIEKKNFHFYSLRHSHVAYLLAHDVPLYAISKRLGHKNMTITANTYAYMIDELKARSNTQIDEALGKLSVPKSVPTSKSVINDNNRK